MQNRSLSVIPTGNVPREVVTLVSHMLLEAEVNGRFKIDAIHREHSEQRYKTGVRIFKYVHGNYITCIVKVARKKLYTCRFIYPGRIGKKRLYDALKNAFAADYIFEKR